MEYESADIANEEQVVIWFRQVDEDFQIHENFIKLYPLPNKKADSIAKVISI